MSKSSSSSPPMISSKSIDSLLRVTFRVRGGRPFCIRGKFSFDAPPRLGEGPLLLWGSGGGWRICALERFFARGAEIVTDRTRATTGVEGLDIGEVERLASRARGTMTFWDGLAGMTAAMVVVGVTVGSSSSRIESTRRGRLTLGDRVASADVICACEGSTSGALCLFLSCLYT